MLFLLPSCEEIPPEALPDYDTISSPKSDMPASEPFIFKGTVEHSSNCAFLIKINHFLSFWKSLSSTKLTYTQTALSAIYALTLVLTLSSLGFFEQSQRTWEGGWGGGADSTPLPHHNAFIINANQMKLCTIVN